MVLEESVMKNFGLILSVTLLIGISVMAEEAYEYETHLNDYYAMRRQEQQVTVSAARNLPGDTNVILHGNIIRELGNERYVFRDNTGEITVEIRRSVLQEITVKESDYVEIHGSIDVNRLRTEIGVRRIRKL
jgi:uncharacterized protein (TIGR00156 family)